LRGVADGRVVERIHGAMRPHGRRCPSATGEGGPAPDATREGAADQPRSAGRSAEDAYVLLLALGGLLHGAPDYLHAEKEVDDAALSGSAAALSTKLATIGWQAAGEPEP
jgi:hypothetical protein